MLPTPGYLKSLPKAELHLHLEGSITPVLFLQLSQRYETQQSGLSVEQVQQELFNYQDFYDFLETYKVVCSHLREPEDYIAVLDGLGEYFREENIRYAEVIFTPSILWKHERDGRATLEALLERGQKMAGSQGTTVRWILDAVRQFGVEAAQQTAELALEFQDRGVVGIGLGGDENSLAMEEYHEVFSWARAHRLYAHVHAGEIGDEKQVWKALQLLGADRIGHGIQSARDPKLMEYLRQHAVGLDICLTSNLKTGAWVPISSSPFGLLFRRGVPVSLNTDDPGLFQTTLTQEFEKAVQYFQLDHEAVHRLVLQGVHSSFQPHESKMDLMQEFQQEIQSLPRV